MAEGESKLTQNLDKIAYGVGGLLAVILLALPFFLGRNVAAKAASADRERENVDRKITTPADAADYPKVPDPTVGPAVREQWRAVRGAVHQALAARNSRLALYDLRDSLLASDRLPIAFLAAIEEIGDATCLETLAAAYEASSRSSDTWLRQHLASAFRAIVQREALTRRHAALKRVLARWPDATAELMGR